MRDLSLAVCHPDEAEVRRIAARVRGATAEACAGVESIPAVCDAVMIAGPADFAAVDRLLTRGKHVLLVADPCPPADVTETLYAAARASGVRFALANPERSLPSRQLIRQQLAGPLGEPGLIRLHRWESPPGGNSPAIPDALLRDLDVILWLAGQAPDRVYAAERRGDGGRFLQVHIGFSNGGSALLDYTDRLPPGDGYQSMSVIARSGAAYADDHPNAQLLYRGGEPRGVRVEERSRVLAAMAQAFIDATRDGRTPDGSLAEWRRVFAFAAAVGKSIASGTAVAAGGC